MKSQEELEATLNASEKKIELLSGLLTQVTHQKEAIEGNNSILGERINLLESKVNELSLYVEIEEARVVLLELEKKLLTSNF